MRDELTNWTEPFYLNFLHGNYAMLLHGEEQEKFVKSVKQAMTKIDDTTIAGLLDHRGWREKLTGAWFSGLTYRTKFREKIGSLLIESSSAFSGEGYCFALARFQDEKSAQLLEAYLDKWLLKLDCRYDQAWAMSALIWVDNQRASQFSKKYLEPSGLWEKFFLEANNAKNQLEAISNRFKILMDFSREHF